MVGDKEKLMEHIGDTYRISFQFDRLLIRVSHVPLVNLVQQDQSIFLWPTVGRSEDLPIFEGIDDFDLSGVFVETSVASE